jgi:glycosyltransferase involved in cell wall biosynthesis
MLTTNTGMPLVSVVIPTYNRAELLPQAIHSVLGQTYENLECIVVDDASTDNTAQVVRQFADDRLIYLRHETNRRASAARNTGIAHAQGDLIAFLDDDDEWLPAKLEKQVPLIQSLSPDFGLVYCWMDYHDAAGTLVIEHHPSFRGYVFPRVLGKQRIGGCPTLLARREVVEQLGGFDEAMTYGDDVEFTWRVCRDYKVDVVPEVLVVVHTGHGHAQLSQLDEQGIQNAIQGHQALLAKFQDDLRKYPRQKAYRYALTAYYYSQLGDWRNSLALYWRSIKTFPLSKEVYLYMLRTLRAKIFRPRYA